MSTPSEPALLHVRLDLAYDGTEYNSWAAQPSSIATHTVRIGLEVRHCAANPPRMSPNAFSNQMHTVHHGGVVQVGRFASTTNMTRLS